jgi:hypothetical protein
MSRMSEFQLERDLERDLRTGHTSGELSSVAFQWAKSKPLR